MTSDTRYVNSGDLVPVPDDQPLQEMADDEVHPVESQASVMEAAPAPAPSEPQAPVASAADEPTAVFTPVVQPQQNVVDGYPTLTSDDTLKGGYSLKLPSGFLEDINDTLMGTASTMPNNEHTQEYLGVLEAGMELNTLDDHVRKTVEREGSEWRQAVVADDGKTALRMGYPRYNLKGNDNSMVGARALLQFQNTVGTGGRCRFPLWNTGIWLTVQAPPDPRLLRMHREILSEKIGLGRTSYGMIHSNETIYTSRILSNLAMEYLVENTVNSKQNPLEYISCLDLWTVVAGLAGAIWRSGFPYERSCAVNPAECQHIDYGRLDITKMMRVDRTRLTPKQVRHMSRYRSECMQPEELVEYRNEFNNHKYQFTVSSPDYQVPVRLNMRVPSIAEAIQAGDGWIQSMIKIMQDTLGIDPKVQEREAFLRDLTRATRMREYAHWIESIETDDNIFTDREGIEAILDSMSSDDKILNTYLKEVEEYIGRVSITVFGIPAYVCPSCGGTNQPRYEDALKSNIIPIDVYQTFFGLVVQKISKIQAR